jgi:hypothetical protein
LLFDHVIGGLNRYRRTDGGGVGRTYQHTQTYSSRRHGIAGMFRLPPLSETKNSSIRSTGCYAAAIP